MKRIVAGLRAPELAVFWYIPETDTFIGDRGDVSEGIYFGDFCQLDYDHFDRWDRWRDAYHLPKVEYDHYPRGRIMFNSRIHKYVVVCDNCIADKEKVKRSLCYEYGLDKNKVVWQTDEHYDCNMCRGGDE